MAKKVNNMKMTPIMALSVMALFAMMIPLFSIANNNKQAQESRAMSPNTVVVTPSPSSHPAMAK